MVKYRPNCVGPTRKRIFNIILFIPELVGKIDIFNEREKEDPFSEIEIEPLLHLLRSSGDELALRSVWTMLPTKVEEKDSKMISTNVWVGAAHQPKVNESWSICNLIKPNHK